MGTKTFIWLLLGFGVANIFILCVSSDNFDPYSMIGVSRTASQREIKKAYKNLARQWHPDKNKEDGAQDKFIQIQQAYEILSDEEKRAEYDLYGRVDTGNRPSRQQDPFSGFHFGGGFDNFQFRFTNQGSSGYDPRRVTLAKFETVILPESHRMPFLLFVTGDWCFSCVRVEGIWNEAVPNLEALGVGMGSVHGDYSRPLLRKLGVYQWPSIVGVIEGRVVVFDKNQVSTEKLKEFVQSILPAGLVTQVSDANHEAFLFGWQEDNKPRSLLFSRRSRPSLLYSLLALKFRDVHAFGFAQNVGKDTAELVWKFDISGREPTLLIFKEDMEEYVEKIQSSQMDLAMLEEAVTRNRHLFVSRLTSQKVFEDRCPEASFGNARLCIVLITQSSSVHQEHRDFFRLVIKTTESFPGDPVFVHVYQETQKDWTVALGQTAKFDTDNSVPVVVLRRQIGRKVVFDWLPDGWHGNEPEADRKGLIFFLKRIIDGKFTLGHKLTLPELKDENAPHWILMGIYNFFGILGSYASFMKQILFSAWSESSVAVLVVVAYLMAFFVAFAGLLNTGTYDALQPYVGYDGSLRPIVGIREIDPSASPVPFCVVLSLLYLFFFPSSKEAMQGRNSNRNAQRQSGDSYDPEVRRRPGQEASSIRQIQLHELNELTYEKFLASGRQGHILLLLLTDRSSRDQMCQHFKQEVHMHVASQPYLLPAFLVLDKYKKWLPNLYSSMESPLPFTPPDDVGTILAIRPSKNYFYIFRPTSGQRSRGRRNGGLDPGFVGLENSSDSDSDEYMDCVSLDGLVMWLDRLLDGSLPKVVVTSWPSLE